MQGVPSIFSHLINNLPAIHSTLVFVCVKRLPVPTVPNQERILLRRIGPPEYRMYRCAVRYGYKDGKHESELDTFEQLLMASLANYLREEAAGALHETTPDNNSTSLVVETNEDDPMINYVSGGQRGGKPMKLPGQYGRKGDANGSVDSEVESEILYLNEAKESGIVYILGHTKVRAKKSSNFLRKFMINDFYGFMRRNTRSSRVALNVPPTGLLEVGMVHHIWKAAREFMVISLTSLRDEHFWGISRRNS